MNGPEAENPDEPLMLAGEYVLGVLERDERRTVQQQAAVDPRLDTAIAYWERRLTPMADIAPRVSSPASVWARIEQGIGLPLEAQSLSGTPLAANRSGVVRLQPRQPTSRTVRRWQGGTFASLALAAGVAAFFLTTSPGLRGHRPMPVAGDGYVVAVLAAAPSRSEIAQDSAPQMAAATGVVIQPSEPRSDGAEAAAAMARGAGFLAAVQPDGTLVVSAFASVKVPAGKTLELWIRPPDADTAKSLGQLPAAGGQVTLPAVPAVGTALTITLEPAGSLPGGAPSGPVVFAGKFQKMRL